jgi:hypothetical protein
MTAFLNINFMEVTIKHNLKFSFRIERLKSFRDMGTWTKIYLDDNSFDIDENYQDFINRLKQYNNYDTKRRV